MIKLATIGLLSLLFFVVVFTAALVLTWRPRREEPHS